MKFTFTGAAEMQRKIQEEIERKKRQMGEGMRAEMERVAEKARDAVPVKTGALRDSIHATGPEFKGDRIEVGVVAGEGLDYAVVVHEDLSAHHEHGGAKFIERPLLESANEILPGVAKVVKK